MDLHKKGTCIDCGCETSRKRHPRCASCDAKRRVFSEETRRRLSESHKGVHPSEETRRKQSISNLGKTRSDETRIKISAAKKGENHPRWKGGISPVNRQIRNCEKFGEWRKAVFIRDNFTCQFTGQRGKVEAHHIIPLATLMKAYNIKTLEEAEACAALWCIDNGVTLAKQVHKELHWGGLPSES